MTPLGVIRDGAQHLPLFLHVLGAMVLVGAFVLAFTALLNAARGGEVPVTRLGFRALLFGALPAYVVMRAGAEWLASEQGYSNADTVPAWVGIGYVVAEPTLLLLLIALLLSGLALRRARRPGGGGAGGGLVMAAAVLIAIALAAGVVAIFAMTAKPV